MISVQTQKVILNGEKRIRLIFSKSEINLLLLITKLPGCCWSNTLKDWHIRHTENYLQKLNKSFPDHILFYDISSEHISNNYTESSSDKKILITNDFKGNRLFLKFVYDPYLIKLIKELNYHRYLLLQNSWIIANTVYNLVKLMDFLSAMNYVIQFDHLVEKNLLLRKRNQDTDLVLKTFCQKMAQCSYSTRTIEQYVVNIQRFILHCGMDHRIPGGKIQSYIFDLGITGNYSRSSQNQVINSIKLYFRLMFQRDLGKLELPRPRRELKIPVVLSRKEVHSLILAISNRKHRAMIHTLCATGIKLSELLELKPQNFDSDKDVLIIQQAKGINERIISLTLSLKDELSSYCALYLPKTYLFEGKNGNHYSARCLQKILKTAIQKSSIDKNVRIYTLRHCFAIHSMESGTELKNLQQILGHSSFRTTELYAQIRNSYQSQMK